MFCICHYAGAHVIKTGAEMSCYNSCIPFGILTSNRRHLTGTFGSIIEYYPPRLLRRVRSGLLSCTGLFNSGLDA